MVYTYFNTTHGKFRVDPIALRTLPSGKLLHNYGKSPFSMEKSTISVVIFNSYVKLPEGNGDLIRTKRVV